MTTFALGCKPSHPSKLAATKPASDHPAIRACLAAPLSPEVNLAEYDCKRFNQQAFSCCTCCATVGAVFVSLTASGVPGFLGSVHCLYSDSGLREGPPPLQDDGRQLADVMACLAQGLVPYEGPEGTQELLDVTTENVCQPTTPEELKLEIARVTGEHTVNLQDPTAIDQVCAALASKAEVVVAAFIGMAFQTATPGQVIEPEPIIDPPGEGQGWHAIRLSGYRTNAQGKREFRVTNSWGYGWCASGCCWVSEAWVLACSEAWPMVLSPRFGPADTQPAPAIQEDA